MGGWREEGEAVSESLSGFKTSPINVEEEMGVFNLYMYTKVLILTKVVVSLADLYRPCMSAVTEI